MKVMTLCFLVRGNSVLLGLKKRGFGAGNYTGVGGKVEAGEDVETAVIRETTEEINIQINPADLQNMGCVHFLFPAKPEWSQSVHLFRVENWSGTPTESDEIRPAWFSINDIPYDHMWADAPYWLPYLLNGQPIMAEITFDSDNSAVTKSQIKEVMR